MKIQTKIIYLPLIFLSTLFILILAQKEPAKGQSSSSELVPRLILPKPKPVIPKPVNPKPIPKTKAPGKVPKTSKSPDPLDFPEPPSDPFGEQNSTGTTDVPTPKSTDPFDFPESPSTNDGF